MRASERAMGVRLLDTEALMDCLDTMRILLRQAANPACRTRGSYLMLMPDGSLDISSTRSAARARGSLILGYLRFQLRPRRAVLRQSDLRDSFLEDFLDELLEAAAHVGLEVELQ